LGPPPPPPPFPFPTDILTSVKIEEFETIYIVTAQVNLTQL
jgi:hypothetical protein